VLEAERPERGLVALQRERRVGTASRVRHRPADEQLARKIIELRGCMRAQPLEEGGEEILELVAAAVNARRFEQAARRERLQRLDEAAVRGMFEEALDRPRPCFGNDLRVRFIALVPEAQRRTEGEEPRREEIKDDRLCQMLRRRPRRHRVRRAEVEPERAQAPTARS